jgi:hypothetical protein
MPPPRPFLGVAGRPMWPKGVARPPQQFYFFFKKKIFKKIYIDFILFYFLTYPHKKRRGVQTSNFNFMWRGLQAIDLVHVNKNILIVYKVPCVIYL